MKFIEILLKSYSFARRLALVEAEIEEQEGEEGVSEDKSQSIEQLPEWIIFYLLYLIIFTLSEGLTGKTRTQLQDYN